MSYTWAVKSDGEESPTRSYPHHEEEAEEDKEADKNKLSAMQLCQESSGLMATVSTLRSTLPGRRGGGDWGAGEGRRKEGKDDDEDDVGVSRGREWGQMAPLTLEVIGEALRAQHPQLPPITHANARETCAHVPTLSLQFKGLGSLELVWLLERLTRLEVSNNYLTSSSGIDRLPCLTWLDLSFNQIKRLSGIGALRRLEVLALHNNRLERLEKGALQPLTRLQVLTLANNRLTHLSDVWTLRHLKSLASLSLANNPVSSQDYPALVLAHLPCLGYLDHRRVTPQDHAKALDLHRSQVEVVEAEEKRMRQEEEAELERRRNMEAHRRAGVLALDDGSLLARMFRGDKDMGVLLQLPGAHALMTKYRDNFNAVCERVFREGLEHEDQRQTELRLLRAALRDARTRADDHARGAVRELEAEVGEVARAGRELQQAEEASLGDDQGAHEARVSEAAALHEKIDGLLNKTSYDLLTAEVTLSDQIKDVVARAREELGSLVGGFLEEAAAEFQEGRRLAYAFYCRLRELSTKVADECTSVEEQERTARVFEGSDTLQAALAGIHDRHLALIDAREADLREHLQSWLANTLQQIQEEEWTRHRARVEEITTLTARQRQLLYEALPPLQE
ncbi:dynein regulatory complex subunit 3-like [Eriocheir sinensis]|uniref:dynein regulatory complex subunit 3-like n=1 Tax=Eriocheir sinensis TaxID=95602 RepID=UPI0021C7ED73|nr:dynein regulatory complex subunit 3-like [Eriocheir sinensis]